MAGEAISLAPSSQKHTIFLFPYISFYTILSMYLPLSLPLSLSHFFLRFFFFCPSLPLLQILKAMPTNKPTTYSDFVFTSL